MFAAILLGTVNEKSWFGLWITVLILGVSINVVIIHCLCVHGYLLCAYAQQSRLLAARFTGTSPGDGQMEFRQPQLCMPSFVQVFLLYCLGFFNGLVLKDYFPHWISSAGGKDCA